RRKTSQPLLHRSMHSARLCGMMVNPVTLYTTQAQGHSMRRRRKRTKDEYRPIDNGDGTARVPLNTTHSDAPVFSVIDTGDIARVSCIAWQHRVEPDGCEYALGMYHGAGKPRTIRLHRLLLCFPLFQVDHID